VLGVVINTIDGKLTKPAVSLMLTVKLDFAPDRRNLEGDYNFGSIRRLLNFSSDNMVNLNLKMKKDQNTKRL
jgi:hypothetical protein